MFPASPGIRIYLSKGLGNKTSLFFSYLYILFIILIGGIESYVFSLVVGAILHSIPPILTITLVLILILLSNIYSLEFPRTVQIILALFLVISIVFLGTSGVIMNYDPSFKVLKSSFSFKNITYLVQTIGISLFLFVGFEWVTTLGFNKEAYKQKIPNSMQVAIAINTFMFLILCLGILFTMNAEDIIGSSIPQIKYAGLLFGKTGIYFALIISLIAILSTFNAGVIAGARFMYLLGREKYLPKATTKISFTTGAPIGSIIILSLLVYVCSIIIVNFEIQLEAAIICSCIICFIYTFLILSLLKIKKKKEIKGSDYYKSNVPDIIKKIILILLFLFGSLSIFSLPEKTIFIITGLVVCVILSYTLTSFYLRKKKS
jgi:amino acid transporter